MQDSRTSRGLCACFYYYSNYLLKQQAMLNPRNPPHHQQPVPPVSPSIERLISMIRSSWRSRGAAVLEGGDTSLDAHASDSGFKV
jgi:hypothetical protein